MEQTKKLTPAGRRVLARVAERGNINGATTGEMYALKKLRDDGYLTENSASYRAELTERGRQALA
jgi:hypothetical protein